jgi:hypothetical protein
MKPALLALGAAAIAFAAPAFAHHSFAMFDTAGPKKRIEGEVIEFQWTNPHAFIEVSVPDEGGGEPVRWSVEMNSPNNLSRQGWRRDTVVPGDKVVVEISPLRDGEPGGLFYTLTKDDGTEMLDPTAVAARSRAAQAGSTTSEGEPAQ